MVAVDNMFSSVWDTIQNMVRSVLYSLGLAGKEGSLLLLGLDNAGKTTLLHRLKTGGDIRPFPPTDRPTLEEFTVSTGGVGGGGRLQFCAWDLGGHECVRHMWEDYVSTQVSAILFLVDASDDERLEEAAYELDALVGEGLLQDIPVALLLNKCDLPTAMDTAQICQRLEYERLRVEHSKHLLPPNGENGGGGYSSNTKVEEQMAVFRISVLKGEGYQDAFRWISGFL